MWQQIYALMRPITFGLVAAVAETILFTLIVTPVMMIWVRSLSWSRVAAIVLLAFLRAVLLALAFVSVVWLLPGRSFAFDASVAVVNIGFLAAMTFIIFDFGAAKQDRPEYTTRWWLTFFIPSVVVLLAEGAFWMQPQDDRWRLATQAPEVVRGRPTYVVAALEGDYLRDEQLDRALDQMKDALRVAQPRLIYVGAERVGDVVRINPVVREDVPRAERLIANALPKDVFQVTETNDGWIEARLAPDADQRLIHQATPAATEAITRRINAEGHSIVRVAAIGDNRILIQTLGTSPEVIRARLAIVGRLTLHIVAEGVDPMRPPPGFILAMPFPGFSASTVVVRRRPEMTGERFASVRVGSDAQAGKPVIQFQLDAAGTRQFCRITRERAGHQFAILMDGRVITAPVINEPICGGSGQISGNFTRASAQAVVDAMASPPLPAPIHFLAVGVGKPSDVSLHAHN